MKARVVYWNNIPSPYVVDRFNALARRGSLDFEAWFTARTEPDRSWDVDESSWEFRHRYLPRVAGKPVPAPVLSSRPDLLVSLYAAPSFLAGWALARARGTRTAFWVEPTRDEWVRRRAWKEAVKRTVFPRVDGFFTTGSDGRAFVSRYGARQDAIFTLPYFAAYDFYASRAEVARAMRDGQRAELGLVGSTFLYVGRLWWGKGLDHLLDAFAQVQARVPETSLVLAGDGDDEQRLRERVRAEGLRNVVFTGFWQKDRLPALYAACDAFVFPTLGDPFGLVVEEAMACGLPVIASAAAGEIRDRIDDGRSGFVVPAADADALAARMEELARDRDLRARLATAAAERVRGLDERAWCSAFEAGVSAILARPRGAQTSTHALAAGGRP